MMAKSRSVKQQFVVEESNETKSSLKALIKKQEKPQTASINAKEDSEPTLKLRRRRRILQL